MELKKIKSDIVNKAKINQAKKGYSMTTLNTFKFLWCPHNYRLRISKINKPIALTTRIKSAIKIKHTERTNKYTIKNFNNLTIEVNPNCIIVIYPSEKWYLLKGSMIEINKRLDNIINKIEIKCIKEAKKIINILNINANIDSKVWVRHEDHIKSDEFLGKIDPNLIMDDKLFKKVYPEGIEFKSPFNLKTFVNNRALEMVAPEIAIRLDKFIEVIDKVTNIIEQNTQALHLEIYNKQLHQKVLEDISKSMKHLNSNILKVKYSGRRLSGLERKVIGG